MCPPYFEPPCSYSPTVSLKTSPGVTKQPLEGAGLVSVWRPCSQHYRRQQERWLGPVTNQEVWVLVLALSLICWVIGGSIVPSLSLSFLIYKVDK